MNWIESSEAVAVSAVNAASSEKSLRKSVVLK